MPPKRVGKPMCGWAKAQPHTSTKQGVDQASTAVTSTSTSSLSTVSA